MRTSPPESTARTPELDAQLRTRWATLGQNYTPRTGHKDPGGIPLYTNRLLLSTSPYLLQHAHNPVDWFPWSDEAFALAERLGRPVFLSIGYSTCHWCHVMEHESFENEKIAALMNSRYVCIKLDREERPDIDAVYMRAVQLATGGGGWPMSVWLFADKRPFYAGTYFPAHDGDRGARFGFATLLSQLADLFAYDRDRVQGAAQQLTTAVRESMVGKGANEARHHVNLAAETARLLLGQADREWGGFGHAPKFPIPSQLDLVLRFGWKNNDADTRQFVELTLDRMAEGGIYDHLAGGFARYATDRRWLVPHFEKMLYDNAQLVCTYLDGYQWTQNRNYATVATETLDYLVREMSHPLGGFYSATDADSEGEEGKFFVWTPAEIETAVGADKASILQAIYGVRDGGNWEGTTILNRWTPLGQAAARCGLTVDEMLTRLPAARSALYEARLLRVPPGLDDKILLAWNGLAIRAFAHAGLVLNNPRYIDRAIAAARFVLEHMRHEHGLYRVWRDGRAHVDAMLDDYAFLTSGLLALFEVTGDVTWLRESIWMQGILDNRFRDEHGGYWMTADDQETLLAREKPAYDGAEPSGNSLVCENLVRLGLLTADVRYTHAANTMVTDVLATANHPTAVPRLVVAIEWLAAVPREVVVVTTDDEGANRMLLQALAEVFDPYRALVIVPETQVPVVSQHVPWVHGRVAIGGKPTAYVCSGMACQLPTRDAATFAGQLRREFPAP